VRYRFGRALHDAKRYDEAIREFGESAGLEPAYADSYYYLGLSSEAAGRRPEAISAYEAYLLRVSREVKQERLVAENHLAELKKAP
jgi:tetratricopeptide (TPR) repeat protein